MPEQALYLKWRPATFNDVIGQEHVTRTLQGALRQGRVRHAYLFSGPRGTGKTTTARLLAKAVNCENDDPAERPCNECPHCVAVNEGRYLDLIEIDAASHTGVDDVRELRDKIAFSPGEGEFKVYIIDEVHRFSGPAFDALLKTLEEPPNHAIFVLATTELEKVPDTILSRCLPFEFRRVSVQEVAARLRQIADSEGFTIDQDALELIARQGTGSVRDSISLLDQVVADPDEHITLEIAENALGAAGRRAVSALVDRLLAQDVSGGLAVIHAAVDGGADPRQFARQMVEHLRYVLLVQTAGPALVDDTEEARQTYTRQAAQIGRRALLRAIRSFNDAHTDRSSDWQPQLPLELALLDSLTAPEETVIVQQAVATAPAAAPATPAATQPPAPPEPEPAAAEPGTPPVIGVMAVRGKWQEVRTLSGRYHHTLPALLEHFQVREISGNTVILAVKNPVFKDLLEAQERRAPFLQTLRAVFNQALTMRIDIINEAEAQSGATSQHNVTSDGLVASAMELGGEISEIRPGPTTTEEDSHE